jgi:hypothetical protein
MSGIGKVGLAVLMLAGLAGCENTTDPGQRALGGGAIGAAAGAGLGGIAGGGSGALTGALIGGAVGALGGIATTPHPSNPPPSGPSPSGQYQY